MIISNHTPGDHAFIETQWLKNTIKLKKRLKENLGKHLFNLNNN